VLPVRGGEGSGGNELKSLTEKQSHLESKVSLLAQRVNNQENPNEYLAALEAEKDENGAQKITGKGGVQEMLLIRNLINKLQVRVGVLEKEVSSF